MSCHSYHTEESAGLLKKRFGIPSEQGITVAKVMSGEYDNESAHGFFEDKYLPGAVRILWLDQSFAFMTMGLFGLLALHGYGRYHGHKARVGELYREYLLPLSVRLWHWANALLFMILLGSGVGLHFAIGSMEWMVEWHRSSGVVLALSWLAFVVMTFIHSGDHYRVRFAGLLERIKQQADFYLRGILQGEDYPFHASTNNHFNPMQQLLSYNTIMFGLISGLLVSGLMMLYSEQFSEALMSWVRIGHYLLAVGGLMFMVVHLYLITTGDRLDSLLKSVVDGYHRGRKHV